MFMKLSYVSPWLVGQPPKLLEPVRDARTLILKWEAPTGGQIKQYRIKGGPQGEVTTTDTKFQFFHIESDAYYDIKISTEFYPGFQQQGGGESAPAEKTYHIRKFKKSLLRYNLIKIAVDYIHHSLSTGSYAQTYMYTG